jgi:hypothetical protein
VEGRHLQNMNGFPKNHSLEVKKKHAMNQQLQGARYEHEVN